MSEENAAPAEAAPTPDGVTVVDTGPADPMAGKSVMDAIAGAAPDTASKWTPMEIVDGQAVPLAAPPAGVHLLDRARALPELAKDEIAHLIEEGIQAFKDLEGRTMRVVHRLGQLFKQEV